MLCAIGLTGVACAPRVRMDPIRVEPIHITMDVQVKVDRQLDRFFDFEEKAPTGVEPAQTTPSIGPET